MGWLILVLGAVGSLLMGSCGDDSSAELGTPGPTSQLGESCMPGALVLCACPGGQGSVTCGADGTVGACFCPSSNAGSGGAETGGDGDGTTMGGEVTTSGEGPKIPPAPANCPNLATGMVTVRGQQVQLWVGTRQDTPAPIFFYYHGTGSSSAEASQLLAGPTQEIVAAGGMVASFTTSTGEGSTTSGNDVWSTGDYGMADDLLACAVQQLNIDTRRVYAGGCSAGGLHASMMIYGRSSYMAGAMPNSGGIYSSFFTPSLEDPAHVPSVITTHGGPSDMVGITFSESTATLTSDLASKGAYVANCDHGGGHCRVPADVTTAQWEYLKAHPFGVDPDPYPTGLPGNFPSSCVIVN